jgi:hypothetical protein
VRLRRALFDVQVLAGGAFKAHARLCCVCSARACVRVCGRVCFA